MVSVIAIGSGVFGSYFEGIRVEVRREILRIDLVCPGFFGWALIASLGLLSGCVDGNGARYWMLIFWLTSVIKEIKKPLRQQGVGCDVVLKVVGYTPIAVTHFFRVDMQLSCSSTCRAPAHPCSRVMRLGH